MSCTCNSYSFFIFELRSHFLGKAPYVPLFPQFRDGPYLVHFLADPNNNSYPSAFVELISHSLLEVKSQEGKDFFFLKIMVVFLVPNIEPDMQ